MPVAAQVLKRVANLMFLLASRLPYWHTEVMKFPTKTDTASLGGKMTFARKLAASLLVTAGIVIATPAMAEDGHIDYRIKRGDTLHDLAARYFRSSAGIGTVQRENRIRNANVIAVGQTLRIPRSVLRYRDIELQVAGWSGPVTIGGRQAARGMRLREGDIVQTGRRGFVSFQSAGNGQVTFPSSSRARLVHARRYILGDTLDVNFRVLSGRSSVTAPKLRDGERFRVGTPIATTAVRGTEFRVSFDEESGLGTAEVTEGTVAVDAMQRTSAVEQGFGLPVSDSGAGAIEALLPPPPLASPGATQTAADLSFTIEPGMAASAYRVQVSRDAGFLEVLDETVVNGGEATLMPLDDGRYFVRARAISENGIEGLSEIFSFRRKRLGASVSAEPSPLADGYLFRWQGEGQGSSVFAFQLWREGQPGAPLVDETGLPAGGLVVTDLEPGAYEWRVAAIQADPQGMLKIWGPTQKLTTAD